MIELTPEQWQALAQHGDSPPRALDPETHITYSDMKVMRGDVILVDYPYPSGDGTKVLT